MDGQPSISSLAERLSGSRRERGRDHKEHRLSKADIGGPIANDDADTPESLGAPLMVLRCVIIQRDEKGYGLTVSGDNPVYVQSVKENGAAALAGVRTGDRIIKVNGTKVTEYNHIEVVKLIKSGPHVALSLLGPPLQGDQAPAEDPNNSHVSVTSKSSISNKRPFSMVGKENSFYDEKVKTIKKMLEQERTEVERIKEEYAKDPNKKLLSDLAVAQKLLQDLEKQLWKAETSAQQNASTDIPLHCDPDSSEVDENSTPTILTSESTTDEGMRPQQSARNDDPESQAAEMEDNPDKNENQPDSHQHRDAVPGVPDGIQIHNPDIMNFEDDEIAEETNTFQDHGPFQNMENLRRRPAHMAVFINYVFRSHEPCSLLLVLTVEHFRQSSSVKDMLKQSDNICKTYLSANSPLKVDIDDGIAKSIYDAVHTKNISDDALRTVFSPAVQHAMKDVAAQLQQFRNKREQGLSTVFGEDKISLKMDHNQEIKVMEEVLMPIVQDLGQLPTSLDEMELQKIHAKVDALERFIAGWTGKRKSKITSRIGSMLRPSRPVVPLRPKTAGSMESILDEQNKRISILGKWAGKKGKRIETNSTVIPVVQAAHTQDQFVGEPGQVSHMVSRFQDPSFDGAETDNGKGLAAPSGKREKNVGRSGSFRGERRNRSATGKSNSDPDVNTVEQVLSASESSDLISLPSSTSNNSMVSASLSLSSMAADDYILPQLGADPDLEVEPESQWSFVTPKEVIKQLDKKECKRQEIIHELLHTERHHVRDLLILDLLFYKRMQSEGMLNADELYLVFPNLEEMLRIHRELKNALQEAKERDGHVVTDIADILLATFGGAKGDAFKEQCAKYCGNQTAALEFIKEKCKKDQKFCAFIQNTEKHPICRRLQLKDFVPMEFQRLTKYPLLLENIIKSTRGRKEKEKEEANKLHTVSKQCKEILSYVNKAVKAAEDHQKIIEIQKNLDASSLNKVNHPIVNEYRDMNLVERTLVHQGPLIWRITQTEKKKSVVLHCVLFEDIMVLLQKQDERYVLKCHTSTVQNSSKDEKSTVQPPILKLSKVIVRNVATDKRAFFVVSMSEFGPQIYELVASTTHETQEWLKILPATAEQAKKKDTSQLRRDAFLVAGSSKSARGRVEKHIAEEQQLDLASEDALDGIAGEDVNDVSLLRAIRRKHEVISTALNEKHNLISRYAGIKSSELENVLDMSQLDADVEPKTIALRSLMSVQKLTTVLNDVLTPDTVFLQPQVPLVLPTHGLPPDTLEVSKAAPGSPAQPETDSSCLEAEDSQTLEVTGLSQTDTNEISQTTLDVGGDSAEVTNLSDYETASEPTSGPPSVDGDSPPVEHSLTNENTTTGYSEDTDSDDSRTENGSVNIDSSAFQPDTGIGTSEADKIDSADNTTADTISTGQLFSPVGSADLLDFGEALAPPPAITVSSSPLGTSTDANSLMARMDPISITHMLEVTRNLESQLMALMDSFEKTAREKEKLIEEKENLSMQLREATNNGSAPDEPDGALSQESCPENSPLQEDVEPPPTYADVANR